MHDHHLLMIAAAAGAYLLYRNHPAINPGRLMVSTTTTSAPVVDAATHAPVITASTSAPIVPTFQAPPGVGTAFSMVGGNSAAPTDQWARLNDHSNDVWIPAGLDRQGHQIAGSWLGKSRYTSNDDFYNSGM